MTIDDSVEIAVIGAGIAGIATAYYLCEEQQKRSIVLVDSRHPMSLTSAQSGDNYRNWWPHPTMTRFANDSIDLMERIAHGSSNVLRMTRRGYALATRRTDVDGLIEAFLGGYAEADGSSIRLRSEPAPRNYRSAQAMHFSEAPDGIDVLTNRELIRRTFPSFSNKVATVLHIRRAGDIDSQRLGRYMLHRIRESGGGRKQARVRGIEHNGRFTLALEGPDGLRSLHADVVVVAAGPYAADVASMVGVDVPITNVLQQKISFDDFLGAIPRELPFSVDLDEQTLDWSADERELLAADLALSWLAEPIVGGVHCRPDGDRQRIKLGWAYNHKPCEPQDEATCDPAFDPQFPEIVIRGAATLQPALAQYLVSFPARYAHYGGYYSMTPENWPLIGPLGRDGAFIVGALSGYGSMAACAAGALCAAWVNRAALPEYAEQLSLARYGDGALSAEIDSTANKGIL